MIKILVLGGLLYMISTFSGLAHADSDAIPKTWQAMYVTVDPPIHEVFSGPAFIVEGSKDDVANAVWHTWWKTAFKEPQRLGQKSYKSEIMLIKLNCKKHEYSVLRDVKYGLNDEVISDSTTPTHAKHFNFYYKDPGKLPIAESNAIYAVDWTCVPPDDSD